VTTPPRWLDGLILSWGILGGVVTVVAFSAMAWTTLAHMGPWW